MFQLRPHSIINAARPASADNACIAVPLSTHAREVAHRKEGSVQPFTGGAVESMEWGRFSLDFEALLDLPRLNTIHHEHRPVVCLNVQLITARRNAAELCLVYGERFGVSGEGMLSQYCRRTGMSPQGLPYAGGSMIKPNQLPGSRLTTASSLLPVYCTISIEFKTERNLCTSLGVHGLPSERWGCVHQSTAQKRSRSIYGTARD